MEKNLFGPRYKCPVSNQELDRRLAGMQAALQKLGVDCAITQTHNMIFDSGIRYFIDQQTGDYSSALLIPAQGEMVYLCHGGDNDNAPVPPSVRNVEKMICNASYFGMSFNTIRI